MATKRTPHRRKWTRATVVAAIRSRHQQGLSMTCVWRDDRSLYTAAARHFGTWTGALAALGIRRPSKVTWTKQRVMEAIQARQRRGLSLTHVFQQDSKLYDAGKRRFGSWQRALEACGIEAKSRRRWTKARIVDELRTAYRSAGSDLRTRDRALANAVWKYFGGLEKARHAAGIERPPLKWSRRRVVEAIQDRHVRGRSIKHADWKNDRSLACAATRYFGSWYDAVRAAGLAHAVEQSEPRPKWNKEKVIHAIQARHKAGLPLTGVRNRDASLFDAAVTHFGCWGKALVAAGLKPARRRSWNPHRVLAEIRARRRQGLPIRNVCTCDAGLALAARRYFGTWQAALDAAGVTDGKGQ
ncbi:MAG: hypothetical protein CML07_04490 [Psychrobacter sp.]|nr:hypothetical protein [Psychrobacter sp.]